MSKIDVLPVTGGCILRANPRNRHFARNGDLHFTGKS
ncbi:vitamin B12-binding protein [Ligilactobacillus ruminis]